MKKLDSSLDRCKQCRARADPQQVCTNSYHFLKHEKPGIISCRNILSFEVKGLLCHSVASGSKSRQEDEATRGGGSFKEEEATKGGGSCQEEEATRGGGNCQEEKGTRATGYLHISEIYNHLKYSSKPHQHTTTHLLSMYLLVEFGIYFEVNVCLQS